MVWVGGIVEHLEGAVAKVIVSNIFPARFGWAEVHLIGCAGLPSHGASGLKPPWNQPQVTSFSLRRFLIFLDPLTKLNVEVNVEWSEWSSKVGSVSSTGVLLITASGMFPVLPDKYFRKSNYIFLERICLKLCCKNCRSWTSAEHNSIARWQYFCHSITLLLNYQLCRMLMGRFLSCPHFQLVHEAIIVCK